MSRPLYKGSPEGIISGHGVHLGRLQRRPLAGEWFRVDRFHDDPNDITLFRDLLTEAGNGWTQGGVPHAVRRHADGSLETRGRLTPGSSGTVAYTLPGTGLNPDGDPEVDYRPDVDSHFVTVLTGGVLAMVFIDATTGDVTITFPL